MGSCSICGASAWEPLPNPRDDRTVLSDLRIVHEPLDKWSCRSCGFVRRARTPAAGLFSSGYALYDHHPGAPREAARQQAYARWIASRCAAPASVLDVGCGNGSLLLAVHDLWPGAALRGLDPSRESVAHACAAGVDARVGTIEDDAGPPADLVVSINVVEHTENPARFVHGLAATLRAGGTLVIVCPDGGRPSTELVFADHLSSFVSGNLARLVETAGLTVSHTGKAPPELGAFHMVIARQQVASATEHAAAVCDRSLEDLAAARHAYLRGWRALDAELSERGAKSPLVCFGLGEAAGLLRAYAPDTWTHVTACVADAPEQDAFAGLPVLEYSAAHLANATLLLGVRPAVQETIAARLRQDGHRVIRWDDLIPA